MCFIDYNTLNINKVLYVSLQFLDSSSNLFQDSLPTSLMLSKSVDVHVSYIKPYNVCIKAIYIDSHVL